MLSQLIKHKEKNPALLKARKNLATSLCDLKVLTNEDQKMMKRSTTVTILKKLLRKHKTLQIITEKKLPMFCSQICQSISNLKLENKNYMGYTKTERKIMQKSVSSLKNLKVWTIQSTNTRLPNFNIVSRLRRIEDFNSFFNRHDIIQQSKYFLNLNSLRSANITYLDSYEVVTPEEIILKFTSFCENLFLKQSLQYLKFSANFLNDLGSLGLEDITYDILNKSNVPNFQIKILILQDNKIKHEKLSKILERSNSLAIQVQKPYFKTHIEKRSSRDILFLIKEGHSVDISETLSKCKSLKFLSLDLYAFSENFPRDFGGIQCLETLKIVFPETHQLDNHIVFENLLNLYIVLSKLSTLKNLIVSTFQRLKVAEFDDLVILLHELPSIQGLESYEVILPSNLREDEINEILQLFYIAFEPLSNLEKFKISIENKFDEKLLSRLLERLSKIKSLTINYVNFYSMLDFPLLFENLPKMKDLEEVNMILPSGRYNKNQLLKDLPRLANLKRLSIKPNFYNISDEKFHCITISEYHKEINSE